MEKFKRENYLRKIRGFYDDDDNIKVITGVRRCGQSSLMETIANEIRDKGVPETNIIYIDLDKRGNRNIKTADALEEMPAYFLGQKNLDDVIKITQDRVLKVLNERE